MVLSFLEVCIILLCIILLVCVIFVCLYSFLIFLFNKKVNKVNYNDKFC